MKPPNCTFCNHPAFSYVRYSVDPKQRTNDIIVCSDCQALEGTNLRIWMIKRKIAKAYEVEYKGGYQYDWY